MGDGLYRQTGEFKPDRLIADNAIPVTAKGISLAAGQGILVRGTLLGAGTDGNHKIAGGEEKTCDCILADDTDTTGENAVVASAYVTGSFNRDAIVMAEGEDPASYETELRKLGIFLRSVQEY